MTSVQVFFKNEISFFSFFYNVRVPDFPTLSPCFREAALPASPQSVCLVRLEAIDQSQSTAHRSMLECVYVWKRPREKVS